MRVGAGTALNPLHNDLWIGAYRTQSTAPFVWIDGTDAANLNCGGTGCDMWESGFPT